jgi:serine/threonine protein kinase
MTKKGLGYTQTDTPYYASPEVWNNKPYDAKSDIWSLDCVLYEMIILRPPFQATDIEELYKKVLKGSYRRIPHSYSQTLAGVVRMLLQVQANRRPAYGNLLNNILDQVLKLPTVINRIEKLFPELRVGEMDESVLLSTIRVPDDLM